MIFFLSVYFIILIVVMEHLIFQLFKNNMNTVYMWISFLIIKLWQNNTNIEKSFLCNPAKDCELCPISQWFYWNLHIHIPLLHTTTKIFRGICLVYCVHTWVGFKQTVIFESVAAPGRGVWTRRCFRCFQPKLFYNLMMKIGIFSIGFIMGVTISPVLIRLCTLCTHVLE